jgi:predicted xylose isomerase-like sugar epimerase
MEVVAFLARTLAGARTRTVTLHTEGPGARAVAHVPINTAAADDIVRKADAVVWLGRLRLCAAYS